MKDEDQYPRGRGRKDDETVASLLTDLPHMRRSVPVNYQLKAELKKQLLQRMKELEGQKRDSVVIALPGKRRKQLRIICAIVIAAVTIAVYSWWEKNLLTVEAHSLLSLPKQTTAEQIDIDPTGTQLAYLSSPAVIRSLPLDEKKRSFTVSLPPTQGEYSALSWANHRKLVAVVEQDGQQARIWMVEIPDGNSSGSSRLLKEEDQLSYHSPTWAPNDETIAYTRVKNGVEEIWTSSTVSFQKGKLAEGSIDIDVNVPLGGITKYNA